MCMREDVGFSVYPVEAVRIEVIYIDVDEKLVLIFFTGNYYLTNYSKSHHIFLRGRSYTPAKLLVKDHNPSSTDSSVPPTD